MGIDWFTFVAQILNFVILLFLLKRFLYRPVLNVIAKREESIRGRLEAARQQEEQATAQGQALHAERAELEGRRSELLAEAERQADERRQELTSEVRDQVAKVRDDWRESLRQQRDTFLDELRIRVGRESYTVVARAIRDLADADLGDRTMRVFLERMQTLPEEARAEFVKALARSSGRLSVRSAFPLDEKQRDEIVSAVRVWTESQAEVTFRDDPDLSLGIEMRAGDRRVGWGIDSYLEELAAETDRYLQAALH